MMWTNDQILLGIGLQSPNKLTRATGARLLEVKKEMPKKHQTPMSDAVTDWRSQNWRTISVSSEIVKYYVATTVTSH